MIKERVKKNVHLIDVLSKLNNSYNAWKLWCSKEMWSKNIVCETFWQGCYKVKWNDVYKPWSKMLLLLIIIVMTSMHWVNPICQALARNLFSQQTTILCLFTDEEESLTSYYFDSKSVCSNNINAICNKVTQCTFKP